MDPTNPIATEALMLRRTFAVKDHNFLLKYISTPSCLHEQSTEFKKAIGLDMSNNLDILAGKN